MKRIKYIFLIAMIIVSILGLLFIANCAADMQGKSKKAILYKVECLDYGKVDSIVEGIENVLGNVPGNVESITFKPIADPSSKIEVEGGDPETEIEYLGSLMWKLKIKTAAYNTFRIIVKSEDNKSKTYSFKVSTVSEMKSFYVMANGSGTGYLKSDKSGVIGNDVSVHSLYPTIKVDLSQDITNLSFKVKFTHTGKSVLIAPDTTPETPSLPIVSESTVVDFSKPVVRALRILNIDGTSTDYRIFVGRENTTIYTDEQIVNGVAVLDENTIVVLAKVDNTTDNVYISGGKTFVKSQWNDNTNYADEVAAIVGAGGKPMYLASGMFRGKYIKYYPVIKPSDVSLYQLNMVILNTATPTGNATDIYQEGNAPYMNYDIDYNTKKYVSVDFSVDSSNYIIAPPIYVRGRPINLMWYAESKAKLEEAVTDPDYNGKYSIMKSQTFTAVNKATYEELAATEIMAGNWDWKIGEGVVPTKWLYFSFHFGRKGDNVVFSSSSAHTNSSVRKWYAVDAGEAKPNWNNTFVAGKKYTWYIKNYVKPSEAMIMIVEE